jgi:hypothetical protein
MKRIGGKIQFCHPRNPYGIFPDSLHRSYQVMHSEILNRILRTEPEKYLVPGSTPVISFGDFTTSDLLTLSINPSSKEFQKGSKLLPVGSKRLVDKELLGIRNDEPINETHAKRIWEGCQKYFSEGSNPYSWFNDLDLVLGNIGRSYRDGKAAHVDLVQWATFPAWASIPRETQNSMVDADLEFLKFQIRQENVRQIVINGRQVFDVIRKLPDFDIEIVDEFKYQSGNLKKTNSLFIGTGPQKKKVIGWTSTLKALKVSNDERERIYDLLGKWISKQT